MRTVTVGDQILNIRSNEIPHQSLFLTIRQQGGWESGKSRLVSVRVCRAGNRGGVGWLKRQGSSGAKRKQEQR